MVSDAINRDRSMRASSLASEPTPQCANEVGLAPECLTQREVNARSTQEFRRRSAVSRACTFAGGRPSGTESAGRALMLDDSIAEFMGNRGGPGGA